MEDIKCECGEAESVRCEVHSFVGVHQPFDRGGGCSHYHPFSPVRTADVQEAPDLFVWNWTSVLWGYAHEEVGVTDEHPKFSSGVRALIGELRARQPQDSPTEQEAWGAYDEAVERISSDGIIGDAATFLLRSARVHVRDAVRGGAEARIADLEAKFDRIDDDCGLCPHPRGQHQSDWRDVSSDGRPIHVGAHCKTCWAEHVTGHYIAHAFIAKSVLDLRALLAAPVEVPAKDGE